MRQALILALLCPSLPLTLIAQTSAGGGIHCSIQAAAAPNDADRAFIAGDFVKAESLYSAQLTGASATTNYLGTVRAQLAQNKLAEALATAQHASASLPPSVAQALLGDVLFRSGKVEEAGSAYNKAVASDPCGARGQYGLGRVSDLTSHHSVAAHKYAAAHMLAPADAEITAAFLTAQPTAQRAAGLRVLLAKTPVLAPEEVERLSGDLAVLDQHKTCTVTQPFADAKLTLEPIMFDGVYERSWGFKVRFNDKDSPLLELDSSVSGIVLNQRDAQRAGVKPLTTVPSSANVPYLAVADRVKIGNLEYHDCPVRVVPPGMLTGPDSLIGTDFFRDHLIHIDYVAKLLTLSPFPVQPGAGTRDPAATTDPYVAPDEKDWSPIYILDGNLIMPTLVNKKGPFSFLIDTGSGRSVLAPAMESEVLGSGREAALNLLGTSGGIVKVLPREGGGDVNVTTVHSPDGNLLKVTTPTKMPMYRFTKNEFTDDTAVSFDISAKSHDIGYEVSGLLGFYALRNYFLDINYRDGLVQLLFDQNLRYQSRQHSKDFLNLEY